MRESPYEAEAVLQALIAKFPSLLAGDQYAGARARRWLLVGREAALPDDEDAAGRGEARQRTRQTVPTREGVGRIVAQLLATDRSSPSRNTCA